MAFNTRICNCTIQQYAPIIFDSVAYQNSANTIYQAKNAILIKSQNGTLGTTATGNPIFKSDYERMQYLSGRQNQGNNGAGCGVAKKTFVLGTN
jgi:hypothetical protein